MSRMCALANFRVGLLGLKASPSAHREDVAQAPFPEVAGAVLSSCIYTIFFPKKWSYESASQNVKNC